MPLKNWQIGITETSNNILKRLYSLIFLLKNIDFLKKSYCQKILILRVNS